ncbi:cytosolic non-specific dipeptidase-like isoform X1 [Amphibalanus amphitrite]|uniref:cytosolic non-specific dipeptidase-like isoform X1 n=1 Tax=Amphibalanus amphitrite TaxID=1232801 RepID=UPI001C918C3C|nr:cytosolic non-specific dipeptidase-like isoform X1 [Amphibalanus amphitrite]XP_043223370.1 cytosolic non-specific dipeptidase-like isoform X1 [Amphibalanus amphitrite]XP_043223371.1 cytosolic non-specific dipeptidase-like isoform X1 [Amphibalanus amphitrite]XP_043223372.1 cytosolic non-specific dipeptidase-like isoform X1 [Amphibalanus amphitrite]
MDLLKFFKYVDEHQTHYVSLLREAVEIKSVSAWPEARPEIVKMVHWVGDRLKKLGATVEYRDVGEQELPSGQKLALPPVLLGQLGTDPAKRTLCVYGHLDVQPAAREDGWATEPFQLIEKDGQLFGRGATDDKGPVLCWLHAVEALQATGQDIPINIKFVFEGMEESGSEGLDDLLAAEKDKFLAGTDFVCISDNYWLGKKKPCITYGLRGVCYFFIEVQCAKQDLHSGIFGGTVHEAMSDLMYMMNTLVDAEGRILVDGLKEQVAPLTPEERALYKDIDFDPEDYRKDIGTNCCIQKGDKAETLMARWRHPSLSLHGVHGAFSEDGAKTVIPMKVTGKFSIRIVPNMTPESVEKCVVEYLNKQWKKRASPNEMKAFMFHGGRCWVTDLTCPDLCVCRQAFMFHGGRCWVTDPHHPHYQAGARAIKSVFGVEPDLTREGGSIPVTLTFQEVTGKNVMLLPVGACDDGAHSQNEKINMTNYIQGIKMLGSYMNEVSKISE